MTDCIGMVKRLVNALLASYSFSIPCSLNCNKYKISGIGGLQQLAFDIRFCLAASSGYTSDECAKVARMVVHRAVRSYCKLNPEPSQYEASLIALDRDVQRVVSDIDQRDVQLLT